MKVYNYIVLDEFVAKTLIKFSNFEMPMSVLFKVEPFVNKFKEVHKQVSDFRFRIFEKYGNPVYDEKGQLVRYITDGCSEETKEIIRTELKGLLDQESELLEKFNIDPTKINGLLNKEELAVLRIFFNFV